MSESDLQQRANDGDAQAQIALGRQFEESGNTSMARGWFARAVKAGNAEAMRRLGASLLMRDPVGAEAVAFLRSAADHNDPEAAHLCAMLAAQDENLPDRWHVANGYSERAAANGLELAKAEQAVLKSYGGIEALTAAVPMTTVFPSPRIAVVEHFASPQICDWLMARAKPLLRRATVYDREHGGAKEEDSRDNSSISFELTNSDLIMEALRKRIADTTQFSLASLEATTILHYTPGQRFLPHHDFLDPAMPGYDQNLAVGGQRAATFLLYLNDDFEGGETDFPLLKYRYKGRKGDALLFYSVEPNGMPIQRTLHAGLPTANGEKWLLSQWLRMRPVGR